MAELTQGVAVLDPETIAQYGVSGPAARASGVDLDLRRQQPYLAYAELADLIDPPATIAGDAQARLTLLAQEMITSSRLVEACGERLAEIGGPVAVKLGKIIRLPEGQGYGAVEAPLGHRRGLPQLPGREDALAAQAADSVVQQRGQPGVAADRGRRPSWPRRQGDLGVTNRSYVGRRSGRL